MRGALWLVLLVVGCSSEPFSGEPLPPGVVFTYPVDGQRDVPLGARLVVSFSDPIAADATPGLTGPDGEVAFDVAVVGHGKTLAITSTELAPGTTYELRLGEPLLRFTTRSDRPRAGAPSLVGINGSDPQAPGTFRPIFETSTLQLAFSEPLDPRSIDASTVALVEVASGMVVPATLLAHGIHVALDPVAALVPGTRYELRLGDGLVDLSGEPVAPLAIALAPAASGDSSAAVATAFRTWQAGDPDLGIARTDAMNAMDIVHPLIGSSSSAVAPGVLATELGDPLALAGPIAFAIPKGQRLSSAALPILLAGAVPSGLATGDIVIELVTDGGGRLYRNRYRPAGTVPDDRSPLLVDLSFDLAVYATDPIGNAVLAQTVLGVQLTGLAVADQGTLAIETIGALDIDLLGTATAPANIVLDLVSAPQAVAPADHRAPALVTATIDDAVALVFDEPVDLATTTVALRDATGPIASTLELHGAMLVARPRAPLPAGHEVTVALDAVVDLAGNAMAPQSLTLATPAALPGDAPPALLAVYPGAPCAFVDGRCAGGLASDDRYQPFALAANERATVVVDQPVTSGSIRIDHLDALGALGAPVPGTLLAHPRDLAFVPDRPCLAGERYRLRLVAGANATCDAGELCGATGRPVDLDPLARTGAGGPDVVVDFVATPATSAITLLASTGPREDNRVALRIAGASGLITSASFQGADCLPETPAVEACMFVRGAIPAQLHARRDSCALPDGTTATSCVPVTMSAQAMYASSVAMTAAALGIGITADTGTSVMRLREGPAGPAEGYIVDRSGVPTLVVALELYMDAPAMNLPLAQHDLHSKPLTVALEGPLQFRPDGRIAIALHNTAEVPLSVGIAAPLGITGAVHLVVPAGEMKLQLLSPARGRLP